MAYTNLHLKIEVGNVVSRIRGPAPNDALDRAMNPHLRKSAWAGFAHERSDRVSAGGLSPAERRQALVYDTRDQTFLTGALPTLERLLHEEGCPYRIEDVRTQPAREHEWVLRDFTLRTYQKEVVDRAVERGMGTIDLGTSGGKTILAASILARFGLPTIYLVTTRTLLHQTVWSLRDVLGVEPGIIGDGVRRPKALTVAIAQAVNLPTVSTQRWKNGVLIWDEGHHAAAPTFLDLIRRIDARYNFFLSAVPFRSGDDQAVLDAVTGGTLTDGEYSAKYLIDHGYACPVDVQIEVSTSDELLVEQPFPKIYGAGIVENAQRNDRIAEIAREGVAQGESVLILVERILHGRILKERIGDDACFVHGSVSKTRLKNFTDGFARGDVPCLIATMGLFNEGVSINGITVLIQAGGMKSRAKVIQAVGRGMRKAPGKTSVTYVDFFDDDPIGVLRHHSQERLQILMDEGFRLPQIDLEARAAALRTGTAAADAGAQREAANPSLESNADDASENASIDHAAGTPTELATGGTGETATSIGANTEPSAGEREPYNEPAVSIAVPQADATHRHRGHGLSRPLSSPTPIPPTWSHIQGTKDFIQTTAEGQVVARGECIQKAPVPAQFCKRCQAPWVCQQGGKTTWQTTDPD